MKPDIGPRISRARWMVAGVTLLLLLTSVRAPQALFAQGTPLTLTFGPGRDATQAGTVTLTPQANQTLVVINMTDPNPAGNGADQLAHIHTGACPGVGAVTNPFSNLVNGKSTTTLDIALSSVLDGNHSINVHQGTAAPASGIYTACVNLPASGGAAAPAAPAASAAAPPAAAATSSAAPAAAAAAPAAAAPAQAAPRPVPSAPNTGIGPGPARQASAPATASQVTVSAALQLPSTGTGGLLSQEHPRSGAAPVILLLAFLSMLVAASIAWRRQGA